MITKIFITWFLIGRLYMVCIAIYRSGETWNGLFHKRIYRQLIIESGLFGYFTPLFDIWLEKSFPKKKVTGQDNTNLEKEFKVAPIKLKLCTETSSEKATA